MKQAPTWSWRGSEDRKINNGIWKVCGHRDSDLQDPQGGDQSRSNIRKTSCSRSPGVQSGLWRSVGYLSSCQSHPGCATQAAWRWFLMLKFPNAPPTLLLKEPFLKSTTLSKLKRRQLWLVKLLGWIALWMLNSKDSQGVQVWKSSLEEEASSVVLVPGEPLLLLFYYVLCGLQRAQHLPYSETVRRRRTMCFRQLFRTGKARVSSDGHWENSGSCPTNSSLLLKTTEDRTVTLYSWSKTLWVLFPTSTHLPWCL